VSKRTIRVGLLGFGSMGKTHTYAIQNFKFFMSELPFEVKITAVCTTNQERAQEISKKYGFEFGTANEDEIINSPDIDVIDICTPNIYHFETLKKAISAGKHVYCEKPLCINASQAAEIASLAESNKKIHNIVFNNRFIAPIQRAKQIIDEGKLGRILSFNVAYLHSSAVLTSKKAGWKQNKDICGGGVLFDLGSHVIDLIYHLCGEFDEVCALTQIAYEERAGMDGSPWKTNADEAFYMLAKLKNGACGTISASKVAVGANDDIILDIYGEKASLKFSLMDCNWLHFYDNTSADSELGGYKGYTKIECVGRYPEPQGSFPSPKASSGWLRGHVSSMYNFLNSVYTGIQTSPDFNDGAYVQTIMEAAYRSAETKNWTRIEK
jgi:predicted dehydrogenase